MDLKYLKTKERCPLTVDMQARYSVERLESIFGEISMMYVLVKKQNNKNLDNIYCSLSPFTFMSGVSGHRKRDYLQDKRKGKEMLKRPKAIKRKCICFTILPETQLLPSIEPEYLRL